MTRRLPTAATFKSCGLVRGGAHPRNDRRTAQDATRSKRPQRTSSTQRAEGRPLHSTACGITLELTGTYRQGAARRMMTQAACGALPVRVRVERPVRPHALSPSRSDRWPQRGQACAARSQDSQVPAEFREIPHATRLSPHDGQRTPRAAVSKAHIPANAAAARTYGISATSPVSRPGMKSGRARTTAPARPANSFQR